MLDRSKRSEGRSLIVLGVCVLALTALASWSFRTYSVIAGSFQVDDILVCEELSGDMRPLPISGDLAGDLKQACLWFTYSRAREGDAIELSWRYNGETIQRDSFRLTGRSGMRAFYLLREDGEPLPSGDYTVTLFCNGRERAAEAFQLHANTSDDESGGAEDGAGENPVASGDGAP